VAPWERGRGGQHINRRTAAEGGRERELVCGRKREGAGVWLREREVAKKRKS
jgi:hypothetical protein